MPIEVQNLTHAYMVKSTLASTALSDVSLTIREGEFLGVIGHTGSGKSTFVQHLNGLLLPTGGRVLVDGLDTREKKLRRQIRSLVGMVFQYPEYQLFEETVVKDIAFGPKNMGLDEAEIARRVTEAMELVGLNGKEFSEKSPFDLSGGEKRRAALAGILAMRPKYLVLDEPMAGLDPRGRREVLDMLRHLRKATGCAIVMVSHSMDDVAASAERIAVLDHGTLYRLDTPEVIFADAEKLASLGLDLPQASRLALMLRARGFDLPQSVYSLDYLRDALLGRLLHD